MDRTNTATVRDNLNDIIASLASCLCTITVALEKAEQEDSDVSGPLALVLPEMRRMHGSLEGIERRLGSDQTAPVADSQLSLETRDAAQLELDHAIAMLNMLHDRWEGLSDKLQDIVGGRLHTDITAIHAARARIEAAEKLLSAEPCGEVAHG